MKRILCLALSLLSLGGLAQQPAGSVYKVIPPKTGGITIVFPGGTSSPGSGTSAVSSVNNQVGNVVLTRSNLTGTQPASTITGLSPVATSGSWLDLTGKPALSNVAISGSWNDLLNRPALFSGAWVDVTGKPIFSAVATSGSYADLLGKPVLFSGSWLDLTNRPTLFSGAYGDLSGRPALSTVATSGAYADLLGKPVLFSGSWLDLTNKPTLFSGAYGDLSGKPTLSTVATSGSWVDLLNKPTLFSGAWNDITGKPTVFAPASHTQAAATIVTDTARRFVSDNLIARWNAAAGSGFSGAYGDLTGKPAFSTVATSGSWLDLLNRPTLFSGAYSDLSGKPTLSTVATSGSWVDLLNKPTLFSGAYGDLTGKPTLFSGAYGDLSGKPTLSTVAATGSYNDLLNKPTIPGATVVTNNLTTTTTGTALDAAQGAVLKSAVDAKQNAITSATDLTVNTVTLTTLVDSDSSRKAASTDWVRRYVIRTMPTFIDFPYKSSQFTFGDSLSIRADYIRSLFSGSGYNPVTGVITGGSGSSGPWSTTGSVAYYSGGNVGVNTSNPYSLFTVNGNAQVGELHWTGATNSQTDAYKITVLNSFGLQFMGGWATDGGTFYHQGNGNIKADGNLYLQGAGKALFFNNGGLTINNGTNNATATLDVTGTGRVTGNTTFGASVTVTGGVKASSLTLADGLPFTQLKSGNGIDYAGDGSFQLRNSSVITLMENQLRSYAGYDPAVSKVLSTTGSTFQWIVPPTSSSASSGTTSPALSGTALAAANRDSVLINADSTKMRFASSGTTTTNISTVAQLRAFLTSTQTNVRGVLANGTYDDGAAFEQTGTWTNVSLEAANYRQAILQNSSGNLVWINQGGNSRRRVRLKDFVLRTGATDASNGLAIFHHNELPDWDGLEMDGVEIYHTNPTQGKSNGFTFAIYSEGKSGAQDMTLKNFFMHNCFIHDIPRANEFLSHGFDKDRIFNMVVTNNRFERTGVNDSYGAPLSYSGRIKYILTKGNSFKEFNYLAIEHVANRFALTTTNTISSTATNGGVGIAISDNNLNLTQWLYVENNTVNVMSRPFYAYGVKNLYMTGGTYNGYLGADGTPVNSVFKNFTLNVWPKAGQTTYNYCWQFDGNAYGNSVSNITVSSAGAQAKSPGSPIAYTVHLTTNTNNNNFDNVTTILGKQANGSWGGSGAIINDGANTNVITNNTVSRVD